MTIEEIKNAAIMVRDESQISANTANRIGTIFLNIANMLETALNGIEICKGNARNNAEDILSAISRISGIETSLSRVDNSLASFTQIGMQHSGNVLTLGGKRYVLTEEGNEITRGVWDGSLDDLRGTDNVGLWLVRPSDKLALSSVTFIVAVSADNNGNTYQQSFYGYGASVSISAKEGAVIRQRYHNGASWSAWSEVSAKDISEMRSEQTLHRQEIDYNRTAIDSKIVDKDIANTLNEMA